MNKAFTSVISVCVGNFLYAITVHLFLIPSGLVTGGTTGMALTANYLWNIPVSLFVLLFNILMLLVGLGILGRSFAVTTLASTFLYPLALKLCEWIIPNPALTNDLLLCTVFSGLGIGIALGIVIRAGASTGGMDIPPLVLKKLFRIPVSFSMYAFDFCILLSQILFRPMENILYGILLILIYTFVLDRMLILGSSRTEIKVISSRIYEIRDSILQQVDRGVTLLQGEGGYLHNELHMLLSIISNRELVKVEKLIREIDPEAFLIISRVTEVRGHGFSSKKEYK